jgi:glycosyltransferase involved in cell wall biosynthesis
MHRGASMPITSIVIPCFNAGDTLLESVRSALMVADCEVIVVDDGSTDPDTLSVIESLPDDVVVIKQANCGLPAARNAGIRVARAEFVLPLDADDLIEPEYVPEAVEVLQARANVGIVYCHADHFGARSGPFALPDFTLEQILIDNCIFCSAVFRKTDWERVGGYNEKMRHGREDHDFWLRLLSLGREVVRLDGTYFHYRLRDGSMNASYTREQYVEIYSEIFRDNAQLYLDNIEVVIRHRFSLTDQVNDLQLRYGRAERLINEFPLSYDLLRRGRRLLGRVRSRS